ncbi:hydroxymethylbilane synthase [Streptomyces goshikiensis]|uniref:hydroxymethylbilane synthase n=1 Tax=Streptomyces goshikiensis TaxID=1942 RepID=UPI0036560FA7
MRGALPHHPPSVQLEVVEVVSDGDRYGGPLSQSGGKGAFTTRADKKLLAGAVEATIACAKDTPSPHDRAHGITVGAVLSREDPRDVLVLPTGHAPTTLADLPPGTRVGTNAPRRAALLQALYPKLVAVQIRGNADGRLAKLDSGELGADVMIAALAGLRRLGLVDRASEILDPTVWLPAAGAGIVVVEHRTDDSATAELLSTLTHPTTRIALAAERAVLQALEGGCLTAASAHATLDATTHQVTVHAAVLDPTGGPTLRTASSGPADCPADVGRSAGLELLAAGASRLLALTP